MEAIVEAAVFDLKQAAQVSKVVVDSGADFVKTSTSFHRAIGVSVDAVRAIRAAVGGLVGIKASEGIHSRSFAEELIRAGATRLGMSASRKVLEAS